MKRFLTAIVFAGLTAAMSWAQDSIAPGKYMYIPDSLQRDVIELLGGKSKVVPDASKIDPNERVTHNGDTLQMVTKGRNLGRFDRGLFNYLYVPKGQWSFGLTASYGEFNTDDLQLLGYLTDIDLGGHIFAIRPYVSYFIKNNLAIGLRLGYQNAKGNIGSFKLDIDDDMNFNVKDIMYKSESYTAALMLQQYYGLTRRGRFGVYNEVELAFTSGYSQFQRPFNGEPRNTHTTTTEVELNFSPGVQIFVMRNVSFHLSFGVFGFYLRNEKQRENGEDTGSRFSSGANFRFNIFNIKFGIGVHL